MPRLRRAISTSATWPTPCGSGERLREQADTSCCGSRTTTGCAAARSTSRPCSRTWRGSGSCPMKGPSASPRTTSHMRQPAPDSARTGSSTAATAPDRRSRRGPGSTVGAGMGRAVLAAVAPARSTGPVLRVALGGGSERWMDAIVGPCADEVAADGDLPIRDRDGHWTYGFSVVVDDLGQRIDLVVRGRDLLAATPAQIRLGRLLGREQPATFAHHPLIRDAGRAQAVEVRRRHRGARASSGRPIGRVRHRPRGRGVGLAGVAVLPVACLLTGPSPAWPMPFPSATLDRRREHHRRSNVHLCAA